MGFACSAIFPGVVSDSAVVEGWLLFFICRLVAIPFWAFSLAKYSVLIL